MSPLVERVERIHLSIGDQVLDVSDIDKSTSTFKEGFKFAKERDKSDSLEQTWSILRRGVAEVIERIKEYLAQVGDKKVSLEIGVTWRFVDSSSCADEISIEDLDSLEVNFSNQDWWCKNRNYLPHLKDLSELIGCDVLRTASLVEVEQDLVYTHFKDQETLCQSIEEICRSPLVKGIQKVYLKIGSKVFASDYYSNFAGRPARGKYARKHKVEGLYFTHGRRQARLAPPTRPHRAAGSP